MTVGIFDTHAHYDDKAFDNDREIILESLNQAGITSVLNAGCSIESSIKSLRLAEKYDFIYASAGVHPHESAGYKKEDSYEICDLLKKDKVVAIGEIGLDYHYDFSPRDIQKQVFREQLALASLLDVPVIIHEREALHDMEEIVSAFPKVRGVFHCFSGSRETAKELIDKGWMLSFGGAVTFKNARRAIEVLSYIPDSSFMIETDSPYMTPEPFRGKRNDSRYLHEVASRIAQIRKTDKENIINITSANAFGLFKINSKNKK